MALTKVNSVGIATGISLTGITTTQDTKVGSGITLSPDGDVYATGIVTATSYRGDVSNCTGVGQTNFIDAESLNVSGISTLNSTKVGSGITLSTDGDIYTLGVTTTGGALNVGGNIQVTSANPEFEFNTGGARFRVPSSNALCLHTGGGFGSTSLERLRVNSSGHIGIGTITPARILHLHEESSSTVQLHITNSTTGSSGTDGVSFSLGSDESLIINQRESNHIALKTADTERARIDSSGRLLIGTTDTDSVSDGEVPKLIIKATDSTAAAAFVRHSANAAGTGIFFGKSRNATVGSNTIVQSGDELGRITFSGDDGTNINTMGAKIASYVDGSPGENDMPGRLVFYTTADGASTPTERMRILQTGDVNIGNAGGTDIHHASGLFNGVRPKFEVKLGAASNSYTRYINISNPGSQTGSETLGRVGIKLSLGSEASSGESNKSGAIYAESTSGYNNGTSLCFGVGGSERARIASGGQLLVGHTASLYGDQKCQLTSTSSVGGLLLGRWSNSNYSSYLNFFKSRHTSITDAGGTIVQSGDLLGSIKFYGDDGTSSGDYRALAGEIRCKVAGTPGANDMPGIFEFLVSPDNSDSVAERFHIDDAGARVTGLFEAYPSSTSAVSAATFYNNSTGASADCRVMIKTYANQGADPYIKFDSGGSNFIVGQRWMGTTNNFLLLGAGESPGGGAYGMKIMSWGAVHIENEFNMQSFASEANASKYMDVGFSGNTFSMRRTTWDDGAHSNFIHVTSSNVVNGDFNDTSDEKLKENIVSIADGAIADIKKLRPVTFDWKDSMNRNDVSGFIAQEIKTVLPNLIDGEEYDPTPLDAARGTKGGIKGNGYSVNTIGVVAHLTKALQEAVAKIETLETKVAALESS